MKHIRLTLALAALAALLATPLLAGTIKGSVDLERRQGVRPPSTSGGGKDAYGGGGGKAPAMVDYRDRSGVVVYIEEAKGSFKPPAAPAVINQLNAAFVPRILPVLAGATVNFPNGDSVYHNVFSFSDPKPFDLGVYPKGQAKSVTFDKPGVVRVYCSIHANMNAVVLVLPNPYFAATDKKGDFAIANVPAGDYTLVAWHERFPSAKETVTVPAEGEVTVNMAVGVKALPQVE